MNLTVAVLHDEPYNQGKSFMWSDSNDNDTYNYFNPLFKIATVCICLLRQEGKWALSLTSSQTSMRCIFVDCYCISMCSETHISYISLC